MLRSGFRVLGVSVQFTPRIAVGEHPKLRPRILRATESPEMPPLVEIAEVDRLNPQTLRLDSDRLDRSVRNERAGKVRVEPHL